MATDTDLLMKLADRYAYTYAIGGECDGLRGDLEEAIDSLFAELATLAAAVRHCHCNLPPDWDGDCLKDALDVCRRLTAASKANPPAVPAATPEPEPTDDYDLVDVKNNGEAWRYKRGCNEGERTRYFPGGPWSPSFCTRDFPVLGTKFTSMTDAVRWWRSTHPEPAERAEPAKPTLRDRLAEMRHEVDGILKRGGSSHITEIINAIHAVALVVDGVANSHKVDA